MCYYIDNRVSKPCRLEAKKLITNRKVNRKPSYSPMTAGGNDVISKPKRYFVHTISKPYLLEANKLIIERNIELILVASTLSILYSSSLSSSF